MPLTLSHIKTPLKQTIFAIIVAKGEMAQNKQFLHLPQCFHFFAVIIPSFKHTFKVVSMLTVCEKGLKEENPFLN